MLSSTFPFDIVYKAMSVMFNGMENSIVSNCCLSWGGEQTLLLYFNLEPLDVDGYRYCHPRQSMFCKVCLCNSIETHERKTWCQVSPLLYLFIYVVIYPVRQ